MTSSYNYFVGFQLSVCPMGVPTPIFCVRPVICSVGHPAVCFKPCCAFTHSAFCSHHMCISTCPGRLGSPSTLGRVFQLSLPLIISKLEHGQETSTHSAPLSLGPSHLSVLYMSWGHCGTHLCSQPHRWTVIHSFTNNFKQWSQTKEHVFMS